MFLLTPPLPLFRGNDNFAVLALNKKTEAQLAKFLLVGFLSSHIPPPRDDAGV